MTIPPTVDQEAHDGLCARTLTRGDSELAARGIP